MGQGEEPQTSGDGMGETARRQIANDKGIDRDSAFSAGDLAQAFAA
jgi:hypothetical protein